MTGEQLKEILYQAHFKQTDMARALGISQQAFNATLQTKDIKSSTLEKVARVLGCSVADFYGGAHDVTITNTATSVKGDNNNVAAGEGASVSTSKTTDVVLGLLEELRAMRKQNEHLMELLKEKEKQ